MIVQVVEGVNLE